MHNRRILATVFLASSLATAAGISIAQGLQPADRPAGRGDGQGAGRGEIQDGAGEAGTLLELEKISPTSAGNVRERFRRLKAAVGSLLNSGIPVRNILSRNDADAIESLLRDGGNEEAARRVHDAVMKLDRIPAGQLTGRRQAPRQQQFQGRRQGQGAPPAEAREIVASPPAMRLNIHHLANGNSLGNILKLTNPAIDPDGRRLYVCGTKSTAIGVVDMNTDRLIRTFDVGNDVPCGFLLYDTGTRMLYSNEIGGENRIFAIDVTEKRAEERSSLPPSVVLPGRGAAKTYKGLSYTETGYPFQAGYLQEENASYGVIRIRDRDGRDAGKILHGPDALFFGIDEKAGKLYATNTGDGSISVFDLDDGNRKIKDIDVGTSVDEVLVDPRTGNLIIRNRLGGSTLLVYDAKRRNLTTIPNENAAGPEGISLWPTKVIHDEGRLYLLGHYAARIDILDAGSLRIVGRIPLSVSGKPRTDGISTMTMDHTRKILYAAFPELGEVAVADAKSGKWLRTIALEGYDRTRMNPARISLAVEEGRNRLLAFLSEEKTLNIYQAPSYAVERKTAIGGEPVGRINTVNDERGVFYMGNRIVDLRTLEIKGVFPKGDRVIGFNNGGNRVYLADFTWIAPGRMLEKVYEYEGPVLRKQWTMSPVKSIPSSFAFDFERNRFYVGYFEDAVVEMFDLASGEAPSGSAP